MKKTMIAGAVAIALSAPAYAELEGDLSVTYQNQFGYRGVSDIADEAADPLGLSTDDSFDVELNLVWKLSDQWAVVAGGNVNSVSEDNLVDHNRYRAGVRYTAECYTLELGYQHQDLRSIIGNLDSQEVYARLSTECPLSGGTLSLLVAHDTDVLDGTYAELSLNKAWDLCDSTKLDVTAGVSYSFDYWDNVIGTGNDWNHAYVTIALVYQAAENLTISPYVTFSEGFDALDPSGIPVEESGDVVYGVKASVSF